MAVRGKVRRGTAFFDVKVYGMATRHSGESMAAEKALDTLYRAPLDGFVTLRKELAAGLRQAGDLEGARVLAGASKPTRTAWALNQAARNKPDLVTAVVRSRERASAAQKSADADAIRAAVREHRDAVDKMVAEVRAVLDQAGAPLNASQIRRVAETLRTLATDDLARERLLARRLTEDVSQDDPFARMEVDSHRPADKPSSRPVRGPPEREGPVPILRPRPDAVDRRRDAAEEAARRQKSREIEKARARVAALQSSVARARSAFIDADRAASLARSLADKAKRALETLERDLERAREHWADAASATGRRKA
jgi:hypothetical protein